MPRHIKSATLDSRDARFKLSRENKPHYVRLGKGLSLGYRRLAKGPGRWVLRSFAAGKHWTLAFATADDFEDACEANNVLDFVMAQDAARRLARRTGTAVNGNAIVTVDAALVSYEADLKARGKNAYNAKQGRGHLPEIIRTKAVGLLTEQELADYRDTLLAIPLTAGSVNRILCPLKAALELAAKRDARISNMRAWRVGLEKLPNARRSRNLQVITDDRVIVRIVAAAYAISHEFGLLVELAAATGARYSQLARIKVEGLIVGENPRVMIPTSSKGRGTKKFTERPVPIMASLAAKLAKGTEGRGRHEPLLRKPAGSLTATWGKGHEQDAFRAVAETLGLYHTDETGKRRLHTMYCLRHSSITRHLLRGTGAGVVADMHDTSEREIYATYARYISHHADAVFRAGLADFSPAPAAVIPLAA